MKNGPSKICGRQPLQTSSDMICLSSKINALGIILLRLRTLREN